MPNFPPQGQLATIITIAVLAAAGLFATANIWTASQTFSGTHTIINHPEFPKGYVNVTNHLVSAMPLVPATFTVYLNGSSSCEKNATNYILMCNNTNETTIADAIARTGNIYISSGTYKLSSGFAGFTIPFKTNVRLDQRTYLSVPSGWVGSVFSFASNTSFASLSSSGGGEINEISPQSRNWQGVTFQLTNTNGISNIRVSGIYFNYCGTCIFFNATSNQFANENIIDHNTAGNFRHYIVMNYSHSQPTPTSFGFNYNTFQDNVAESSSVTQDCFKNLQGQGNLWYGNECWDAQLGVSEKQTTINVNSTNTIIIGGIMDISPYIQDNSSSTIYMTLTHPFQSATGQIKTFTVGTGGIIQKGSDSTHATTIVNSAQYRNNTLTIPIINGTSDTYAVLNGSNTWKQKQNFTMSSTKAAINIGGGSGADPSTLIAGDLWYGNSGVGFKARSGANTYFLLFDAPAQTISGAKTFTGANVVSGAGTYNFINTPNTLKVGSGSLIIRNPATSFATTITNAAITANRTLNLPLTTQTETVAVQPTTASKTNSTAQTTASASLLFAGNALTITPRVTGNIHVHYVAQVSSNTPVDGCTLQMQEGINTAPTAGQASSGTTVGIAKTVTSATANANELFVIDYPITGLTVGTQAWFEIAFSNAIGGTCSLTKSETFLVEY